MTSSIMAQIETEIKALGFAHFGWAQLGPSPTLARYEGWLSKGYHASMAYLVDHLPIKQKPALAFPEARTALVLAAPYFPDLPGQSAFPFPHSRVSLYARGNDYHYWFRQRLETLTTKLHNHWPAEKFWTATDSAPILERDLAQRAGLGWIGKNACLIDRQNGSLFFVGEILTSAEVEVSPSPSPDFCGNCRRCIDACPTAALTEDRELDSRKCISFWTIESKEDPPEPLRSQMGGWLFGCDICQTVCPWNEKVFGLSLSSHHSPTPPSAMESELRVILTSSNKQLEKMIALTPLSRAGGRRLKRNAILAAVALSLDSLVGEIEAYADHPLLSDIAQWALTRLRR